MRYFLICIVLVRALYADYQPPLNACLPRILRETSCVKDGDDIIPAAIGVVIGAALAPIWGPIYKGAQAGYDTQFIRLQNYSDQTVYARIYYQNKSDKSFLYSQTQMIDDGYYSLSKEKKLQRNYRWFHEDLPKLPTRDVLEIRPQTYDYMLRSKRLKGFNRRLVISKNLNDLQDILSQDAYERLSHTKCGATKGSKFKVRASGKQMTQVFVSHSFL